MAGHVIFKQIPIGPMQNFVYLIGDPRTREAAVVDPAWDIDAILREAEREELTITRALITHTHPDHVGGALFGMEIAGITELLEKAKAKVVIQKAEAEFLKPLSWTDLTRVESGDEIAVGDVTLTLIHTPGHTPGSQCLLLGDRLISGDTLFVGSCGRVDLPGGSPEQLYHSLERLKKLPDGTILFPGHHYGRTATSTIGEEKQTNFAMRFTALHGFLRAMGV